MKNEITLELLAAKHSEDAARALRLDIEEQMLAHLPAVAEDVDTELLKDDWPVLPGRVQAAFTWKADVSITQLRAMEKAAPLDYAEALHYITTSPAKPAIKIEEI